MQEYTKLYDGRPPCQVHSETSIQAAEEISDDAISIRSRVYRFIEDRGDGGATDQEVQVSLSMNVCTEVPRRRELQLNGKVVDSGQRRLTMARKKAVVWMVSDVSPFKQSTRKTPSQKLREAEKRIVQLESDNEMLRAQLAMKGRQINLFI